MANAKKAQAPQPTPVILSDYETGFLACMEMVAGICGGMSDELRKAVMASGSSPAASFLGGAANNAQGLLSTVRAEMDKAGISHLIARKNAEREPTS